MNTPLRILRARADNLGAPNDLTKRQQATRTRLLILAKALSAKTVVRTSPSPSARSTPKTSKQPETG